MYGNLKTVANFCLKGSEEREGGKKQRKRGGDF